MNNCKECNMSCKRTFCSTSCSNVYWGKHRSEEYIRLAVLRGDRPCDVCQQLKPSSAYSLVNKNDMASGRRNTCKKCSACKREQERRDRSWKTDAARILLMLSKQRAKRNNIEHTITLDDIVIPDVCPVFNIPLIREDRSTWYHAPSIDRIDNTRGYVPNNIIIISRRANVLKKDATVAEMKMLSDFYLHLASHMR